MYRHAWCAEMEQREKAEQQRNEAESVRNEAESERNKLKRQLMFYFDEYAQLCYEKGVQPKVFKEEK
uniref:Uncharacterized protein n=1 Tax=Ditylenchus dipsaci TaxID=166011 RepID=A0A915E2E5_9BILA